MNNVCKHLFAAIFHIVE